MLRSQKQRKLCAWQEDAVLERPDKEAAGCVWGNPSGSVSANTLPTCWLSSLGVQNNKTPVQNSGLLARSSYTHPGGKTGAPGHWLLLHLRNPTPHAIARCSQANSLFILSMQLSPDTHRNHCYHHFLKFQILSASLNIFQREVLVGNSVFIKSHGL